MQFRSLCQCVDAVSKREPSKIANRYFIEEDQERWICKGVVLPLVGFGRNNPLH